MEMITYLLSGEDPLISVFGPRKGIRLRTPVAVGSPPVNIIKGIICP
jgi:hypothetical protein